MKIRQWWFASLWVALSAVGAWADAPVLSSIETPYPALQSTVNIAAGGYSAGAVPYGPVGTPLVLGGTNFGTSGTVQFIGYVNKSSVASSIISITPSLWTTNLLVLNVPSGASSGLIRVVASDGTVSNGKPFLVTKGYYSASCPAGVSDSQFQITTSSLEDGTVGQMYSVSLQATGGTTPYTWSLVSGTLPSGISVSSSGVLTGTPTASTSSPADVVFKATDNSGLVTQAELTLEVNSTDVATDTVYSYVATSYDGVGNVTGIADSVMGTWSYNYDTLNRLAGANATAGDFDSQAICWQYDAFGNRLAQVISSASFSAGSGGASACQAQSTASVSTSLATFNSKNQVVETNARGVIAAPSYDAAGNMLSDGANTYLYDAEGRICATENVQLSGYTIMTGYLYDADGNRVAKGTIASMNCDPTKNGFTFTESYVLGPSGEQLTMFDGSGNWQRTNVYVAGRLLGTYDAQGLHFHLNDPLGTRRMQLSGNLATLGRPETHYQSFPFGDQLITTTEPNAPSTANDATPLHFTGKERDSESGNDYFEARYYASSMGRFLSPDPLLNSGRPTNPQTWNRYTYGLNNPLRNIDPTGLYTCIGGKKECSGFADALKDAQKALGNLKKGSAEYNALSSAINSYGKAGVDNGVHVGFGATSGAGSTTVSVLADANGNKMTTVDNPTGQNINVTIDPSKNGSVDQEAITAAHEGSHVADGTALVGALPMNLAGSDAVLGGPLNLTSYQTEMKAYAVSSYTAQGLGLGSLSFGGNVIWNSSWGAVDRQTLRTQGIQHELADTKGLYNVTPDKQGHKLIQ